MDNKLIFVFLDGVGIDSVNENNPFARSEMNFMRSVVGGTLTSGNVVISESVVFKGIDACLGVKGTPQSATGQTALFTGMNAPMMLGYHYPAFPNEELRRIICEYNIYSALGEIGKVCTFANAYAPEYHKLVKEGKRKHSVTTVSMLAAGLPFRRLSDLRAGRAVYWDITNRFLRERYGVDIALIEPYDAGRNLARLVDENDLVVYECFLPDLIGHERSQDKAIEFCSMLDNFTKGIVSGMQLNTTLVITSDHGNIEDLSIAGHTMNPSLLLTIGARAGAFSTVAAITQIKETIIRIIRE